MASLRDIRRRIKSVKNTAQITKAMQMVAASKMRKAQEAALHSRPYALSLNRILVSLRNRIDEKLNPLLEKREVKKELVVLRDEGNAAREDLVIGRRACECRPDLAQEHT